MGAVALWVRATLRRRLVATIMLAVFVGLSAGIVGASLQAARRAGDAVIKVKAAVQRLSDNSDVALVGGVMEESTTAILDGVGVPYIAVEAEPGDVPTLVSDGRAPSAIDEVALGAQTARRLHKGVGDHVLVTSTNNDYAITVEVVGIAVLNNPINDAYNAGVGAMVVPKLIGKIAEGTVTPQSLVVRFVSGVDRTAAIASIVRDFGGSTRLPGPPADLRNLQRLRFVPWMVAALIAALALASLVHALITMLQRHTGDLAVLAALGMTTRQRRRVGLVSKLVIVSLSVIVGLPTGMVLGRLVWRVVARRVFIPSGPVMPWSPAVLALLTAMGATVCVAVIAARLATRHRPAAVMRNE